METKEEMETRIHDTDVTDGDRSVISDEEQLNPAVEQESDQKEERNRSTSEKREEGDSTGGLGPDVATEEEKAELEAEEEGEEGREALAAPAPRSPSRMERDQHELTHTPYRAWCPHCVRMRGRNTAHREMRRKKIMDTEDIL